MTNKLNLERMKNSPIFKLDFYKTGHHAQYPQGTEVVYSTFIPRSNKFMPYADKAVFFGLQGFIKSYLMEAMDKWFFTQPREEVIYEYKFFMEKTLGSTNFNVDHIAALHDLGYMPLLIKALPEGTRVPMRVAMFTIENTHPDFFWLTNYVESLMSAIIWKTVVSATVSYKYRSEFDKYVDLTGLDAFGVNFQGHDFSYRGMGGDEAAQLSGAGHLVNFLGTDTIPAIIYLQNYYNADIETELGSNGLTGAVKKYGGEFTKITGYTPAVVGNELVIKDKDGKVIQKLSSHDDVLNGLTDVLGKKISQDALSGMLNAGVFRNPKEMQEYFLPLTQPPSH